MEEKVEVPSTRSSVKLLEKAAYCVRAVPTSAPEALLYSWIVSLSALPEKTIKLLLALAVATGLALETNVVVIGLLPELSGVPAQLVFE